MADWTWVDTRVALAAHVEQLAEHGGAAGVRDFNMLESAMARPLNLVAYGYPDAAELAAAYACGITLNYPFVDGNKLTAAVVSEAFLVLNGLTLGCDDVEMVVTFLALAAGELSVEALTDWFGSTSPTPDSRENARRDEPDGHPFLPRKSSCRMGRQRFSRRGRGGDRGWRI